MPESFRSPGISDEVWQLQCEEIIDGMVASYITKQNEQIAVGDEKALEQRSKFMLASYAAHVSQERIAWDAKPEKAEGLLRGSASTMHIETIFRISEELFKLMSHELDDM